MQHIDLTGTWTLKRESNGETCPVAVPGDNMSALLAAGRIPDPFVAEQELEVQWVGREDWSFQRNFTLDPSIVLDDALRGGLYLNFESLDTCAEVFVNGTSVGKSDNMFVRRRFSIGGAVRAGENSLTVTFRSPENEAIARSASIPYPMPFHDAPVQSPHRNLLRKVQCHGGWDWGICLMVSGIYGEAYVEDAANERIEYVTTRANRISAERWELDVTIDLYARTAGRVLITVALEERTVPADPAERVLGLANSYSAKDAGQSRSGAAAPQYARTAAEPVVPAGASSHTIGLEVKAPALWWPAGYGDQPLYTLVVTAGEKTIRKTIGFRELHVDVRDDADGRSMTFVVNGRPVFCKGANWIPADALPARHTAAAYGRLLLSAHAAHMNMLRVWGGGQYESDVFYEMCDALGIMVWHDFMFSCAPYPADKAFLSSVAEEVSHQVRRLKDHPSLALWCGNNENLGALTWFEVTRRNRDRYLVDYDRLYEGTIGSVVEQLDPDRTYWPSSPSGGRGDYSDNWHDDAKGDMHYWSVWHEGKSFDGYYEVTPRFCSEFGFQSFPSPSTVRGYAPEGQRNLTSPVMEHHQRNKRGNTIIIESLSRYYRFPEGLDNLLYMSQVQQAFAIKTAVEYWRARRPLCMGALYWQLNDNWPVASWSSIEYSGKWKLLHYAARRFFAPVLVAGIVKDGALEVWACNDTLEEHADTCAVQFIDFQGKTLREESFHAHLRPDSAVRIGRIALDALGFAANGAFAHIELKQTAATNDVFLVNPKQCPLQSAVIERTVNDREMTVTLTTDVPAFSVSVDAGDADGSFDDNCVTLLPGSPRTLTFCPAKAAHANAVIPFRAEAIRVFDLRGSYRS